MTTALRESFRNVGINETEERALVFLIKNGASKASIVAKGTGLQRTTVYSALESLEALGIVSKVQKSGQFHFLSAPPDRIPGLLERAARIKFEAAKKSSDEISRYLSALPRKLKDLSNDHIIVPLLSLANYDRAVLSILLHENFCAIWDPSTAFFRESWRRDTLSYLDFTSQKKSHIKEIVTEDKETDWYCSNIKNPNHELKRIKKSDEVLSDLVIGEKSIVFSFNDPDSPGGVQIFHEDVRRLQQQVFDLLWSRL